MTPHDQDKVTTTDQTSKIEYGERWSPGTKRVYNPITEAEARARHRPGSYYCAHVKLADGTAYTATVSYQAGWGVQIAHLDPIGRVEKHLIYSEREGRMFLEQTMRWWLRPETTGFKTKVDITRVEHCIFKPDGKYYLRKTDYSAVPETSVETESYCTLEDNWVDQMPEFGNYEAYTRFERKIVEIPPPVKKRGGKSKVKKEPEKAFRPRSGVRFTCAATRSYALTAKEQSAIERIFASLAVEKLYAGKSHLLSLNWEPFWHYPKGDLQQAEGEPLTIFSGETTLPDNTERAMLVGVGYWCSVLTYIRRAVPDANWEVFTEDHEMIWDPVTQAYDPDQ